MELIEDQGKAAGVVCEEAESGERFAISAANVVNATGVWADRIRPEELHEEEDVPVIRPSRGTHVLLDREQLPLNAAVVVPAGEERTIFALPWLGQTLIGTTDNDYEGSLEHPPVSESDVTYLLNAVNSFFGTEFGADDLAGAYAGVRPLISSADPKKSVDISRKAELYETSSGLITITGGKLTTWRRMAKMAVDRMVEREFRDAPCRTHEIPLGHPVDEPCSTMQLESTSRRAPTWRAAMACSRSGCSRSAPRTPTCAARSSTACRTCWWRRSSPPARAGANGRRRPAAPHTPRAARRPSHDRRARHGAPRGQGDGARARMGQTRGQARRRGMARGCAGRAAGRRRRGRGPAE